LQIGTLATAQKVNDYLFTHFNTNNGLAGNTVLNVIQDHKGFMWIATTDGLQRYDGKRFLTFKNKPNDPASLPHDGIEDVYEDKKNNLWIQTANNNIGIFNSTRFTWQEVPVQASDPKDLLYLKDFLEDKAGNLYLLLRERQQPIYLYSAKDKAFIHSPLNKIIPAGWTVYEMLIDQPSGNFWLGCDSGLAVYNPGTKQISYRGNNAANDPVITALGNEKYTKLLHIDSDKHFWCTTQNVNVLEPPVVHRYDPTTRIHHKHIPFPDIQTSYREIKKIYTQKNGRTWFCGLPFLMEYKKKSATPFEHVPVNDKCNPKSLTFDIAGDIYEDREQNVWISTTQGLFKFNPDANFFSNYWLQRVGEAMPVEQAVTTVAEMKNGEVWIGAAVGGGLYTYGKDLTPIIAKGDPAARYKSNSVWSIHQHSLTGKVWIGCNKGNIIIYDPLTGQSEQFAPGIIAGRSTTKITEDQNGNLWLIVRTDYAADIIKWDRQLAGNDPKKGYVLVKAFKEGWPPNLIIDQNNFVWANATAAALYKINATTLEAVSFTDTAKPAGYRFTKDGASDFIQYNDSLIITAGTDLHVINMKTGKVRVITRQDGLPAAAVSIIKDNEGTLWMGLNGGGICRYNLAKNIFTVYDKRDGMLDEYFSPASHIRMKDGRLLFYGRNFMTFQPAAMVAGQAPQVVIADFKLLNISLPVDSLQQLSRLLIPYDKNSVTIEFSALSYKPQNKINYYYKMEGLDEHWIPADESLRAMYNYLPPGKYTFQIKTDNGLGQASQVTSLTIVVEGPFWKAWWFYLLLILLIVTILYLLDRERIKQLVGVQKIRTEVALNLHQEVSAALSNINMLGEMARIKADKDIERTKEYIQQISDKSSHMVTAMEDILWSLDPVNDSMERSLLRMREYIDSLETHYTASIDFNVDKNVTTINLDMKKRLEFFILFKESLKAIVQYAHGRQTHINLSLSGNKLLQLNIQDTTAHTDINSPELEKLIKELYNRSACINAEADIHRDHKGMAIILLVPMV
jgi:ligand-binding sensor domain-containing protein/signal transduction histidine kinase